MPGSTSTATDLLGVDFIDQHAREAVSLPCIYHYYIVLSSIPV